VAERAAQRHASGAGHRSRSTSRYGVCWRTSAKTHAFVAQAPQAARTDRQA
jgi:hypothetical protein